MTKNTLIRVETFGGTRKDDEGKTRQMFNAKVLVAISETGVFEKGEKDRYERRVLVAPKLAEVAAGGFVDTDTFERFHLSIRQFRDRQMYEGNPLMMGGIPQAVDNLVETGTVRFFPPNVATIGGEDAIQLFEDELSRRAEFSTNAVTLLNVTGIALYYASLEQPTELTYSPIEVR